MAYRKRNRNRNHKPHQEDNYLMGAFEMLIKECRRLQARVKSLEDALDEKFYKPSGYDDLDKEIDGYEDFWEEWQERPKREEKPVEIKAVSRRNTNDLISEARKRHEDQVAAQEQVEAANLAKLEEEKRS